MSVSTLRAHGKKRHETWIRLNEAICLEPGCGFRETIDAPQRRKNNDRDGCLMELFPDRSRRVMGWTHWPHTQGEIEGIRLYLETGDDSRLPARLYPAGG